MQHVGDQVKEQDMETAMGDHLKYAPDRPGGGGRKRKQSDVWIVKLAQETTCV